MHGERSLPLWGSTKKGIIYNIYIVEPIIDYYYFSFEFNYSISASYGFWLEANISEFLFCINIEIHDMAGMYNGLLLE